ncbi:MAG: hypothetical protein ACKN86_04650 [Crocinitomicaceae bacterium]
MRIWFVSLFLLVATFCCSQKSIKKKFRGTYEGEIPSYQVFNGNSPLEIAKTSISVELSKSKISMKIGKLSYEGNLSLNSTETEIIILASIEGLSIPEKITLNKKNKDMIRFGRSPQPNARLTKVKRSKK